MRTRGRRIERGMVILGVAIVAAAWMAVILAAAPPDRVNYQGVLRDATNHPRTGTYDMVFRLWTAAVGGDEVIVDSHLASGSGGVVVSGGLFNTTLGGGVVTDGSGPGVYTSLSLATLSNGPLYLEIAVNGETLSPRTPLSSTPYAMQSHAVDGLLSSDLLTVSTTAQYKAGALTIGGGLTVNPDAVTLTALRVPFGNVVIGAITATATFDVAGTIAADGPITVRAPTGTAAFNLGSPTLITNLNAEMVGGLRVSDLAPVAHTHTDLVQKSGDTMTGKLSVFPVYPTLTAFSAFGRAGFGVTTATAQIDIDALAVPDGAEPVLRLSVSDDAAGSLTIDNASTQDGVFAPRLRADTADAVTVSALSFDARVGSDIGMPAMSFRAGSVTGTAELSVRDTFAWSNGATRQMTLTADGSLGLRTATPTATFDVAGTIAADGPITVRVQPGTPALSLSSPTLIPNLNAEMVGGLRASDLATTAHGHDGVYVRTTGDTMTGKLSVIPTSVTLTAFSALGRATFGSITGTSSQVGIDALSVPTARSRSCVCRCRTMPRGVSRSTTRARSTASSRRACGPTQRMR